MNQGDVLPFFKVGCNIECAHRIEQTCNHRTPASYCDIRSWWALIWSSVPVLPLLCKWAIPVSQMKPLSPLRRNIQPSLARSELFDCGASLCRGFGLGGRGRGGCSHENPNAQPQTQREPSATVGPGEMTGGRERRLGEAGLHWCHGS